MPGPSSLLLLHQPPAAPAISDSVSAIPDLSARWRADQITGLANGAAVATWPDASGLGFDATQATSGNRPTWQSSSINGRPAVRFTGSPQMLAADASTSGSTQTVLAVFRASDLSGNRTMRGASGTGGLQFRVEPTGLAGLVSQSAAGLGSSTAGTSVNTDAAFIGVYDRPATVTNIAFHVNGSPAGSGTSGAFLNAGLTTLIGGHAASAGEYFQGDIAEIITWNRVLSSTELDTVHAYVASRYGIGAMPGQVTGLAANGRTGGVDLTWTAVSGATSYKVYRGGSLIGTSPSPIYSDLTGTAGVSYSYTVAASNGAGDGTASSAVNGTALATAAPLATWQAALATQATSPATWIAVGDSITEGQGASARANRWIDKTRDSLRTTLGISGGVGYLPGWYGTYGPDSTWQPYSSRSGSVSDLDWGVDWGERMVSLVPGASQTYTVTGTAIDVWYLTGGGTLAVTVDGGAATNINTSGAYKGDNRQRITFGAGGSHTVVVTCSGADSYLSGLMVYNGDTASGVQLYDSAHSGYKASDYLSNAGSPEQWDQLPQMVALADPDLITIALGTNDVNNAVPTATFKYQIASLIARFRVGKPTVSVVVVVMYGWPDSGWWTPYATVLRDLVTEDPTLGIIDFFATMGSATAGGNWSSDALHPSNTGHATMATQAATYLAPTATASGAGALTATAATLSGTGTLKATGTGALAATPAALSAAGTLTATGTSALTATAATATGSGTLRVTGTGGLTSTPATLTGSGALTLTGAGTLSAAPATSSAAGTLTATGTGTPTATPATLTGSGTLTLTGTGAVSATAATLTGSGIVTAPGTVGGTGVLTAPAAGLAGSGTLTIPGAGALAAQAATVAATALVRLTGTGSLTAPTAGLSGGGTVTAAITGSGTLTGPAAVLAGTGTVTGGSALRDITITVGPGRSRTLTATGRTRTLAAVGRSRTLTAEPRE